MQINSTALKYLLSQNKLTISNAEKMMLKELIVAYESIEKELRLFVSKYGNKGIMPDVTKAVQYNRLNNLLLSIENNLNKILSRIDYKLQSEVVGAY